MGTLTTFWSKAMAGYATVVLLLAVGMTYAIQRLDAVPNEQIARLRAEEDEITLVERLRWSGEAIVSIGRGYMLSGDQTLLGRLREAEGNFDSAIRALESQSHSSQDALLVREVERRGRSFRQTQKELVAARQSANDMNVLVRRFETELLPLRPGFGEALDRLVDQKEAAIKGAYEQAATARARLSAWLRGLLAALVLVGLGISWYFARLLSQSYRKESDALETSRKAVAARDELMGIVAHDLRNPLGAITMKAALMRKGGDLAKVRNQAESIENVAMRMEYLIKTMLDVATLEAGRFSVTSAPWGVEDLLHETTEMFGGLSASREIHLEQSVDGSDIVVMADRERVLQVLSNLLGNAVKFTPPGGRVAIAVMRKDGKARFAVSDTGPGIATEHLPRIFDRFWKHQIPGKKGTGLGLYIAKGIIDAHGGQIWAESEPGHGATFYFTLPIVELKRAAVLPPEEGGTHASA
jgi:signal transduction histidine kinase